MQHPHNTQHTRAALCAELSALFYAHNTPITDGVMAMMAPLLDGSEDFAQQRARLTAELERLAA